MHRYIAFWVAFLAALGVAGSMAAAASVEKADNTFNLELGSSWVGGVAPSASDTGVWDNTVTGANSVTFGAAGTVDWLGVQVTNPGGTVTINNAADRHLRLGGGGIDLSSATQNLTVNYLNTNADQTWNIAGGRTLTIGNYNRDAGLVSLAGGGAVILTGPSGATGSIQLGGDNSGFSGSYTQNAGSYATYFKADTAGSANAAWTFNGTWGPVFSGVGSGTYYFGSLAGSGKTYTEVAGTGTATMEVGALNTSTSYSGVIGGSVGSTYVTALTKVGSGTLTLTGASTYTGATNVNGGSLTLGTGGSLANTKTIYIASGATLNLSGAANNQFQSGQNGTGILIVEGVLRATTARANTMYPSTIVLNGGTIDSTAAGGAVNDGAAGQYGAFYFGANRTVTANGTGNTLSGVGKVGIASGITLTLNTPLAGDSLLVSTVLGVGNNGTAGALAKTGAGTVTLSGANAYTGATTVYEGTLALDYAAQNNSKLSNTAALNLAGGNVQLANGSHTETVSATSLAANTASSVTRTSGASVLQLNAITRNANATINFGAENMATTDSLNTNGMLGTWATVGGTDWAINSGSTTAGGATVLGAGVADGFIRAYTGYTDITRLNSGSQVIAHNAASNVRIVEGTGSAANLTLGAATTAVNTLNQSAVGGNSAATIDAAGQTLQANAILVGSGAGDLTIGASVGSGTLQAATAGGELVLNNQSTSGLFVNAVIADNSSASSVTKTGSGPITFLAGNTYTGSTVVAQGTLALGASNVLDNASTLVVSGGTLNIANFSDTVAAVQLLNGDITGTTGVLTSTASHSLQSGSVSAKLGGTAGITKSTAGTVTLSGANSYTGNTTLSGGTLALTGGNNRLPTVTTLAFTGTSTLDVGTVTQSVAGLTLANSISPTIRGSGGSLTVGGTVTANSGDTVNIGSGVTVSVPGTISQAISVNTVWNVDGNLTAGTFNGARTNNGSPADSNCTVNVNSGANLNITTLNASQLYGNSANCNFTLNVADGATATINTLNMTYHYYCQYSTVRSTINVSGTLNVTNLKGWSSNPNTLSDTHYRYINVNDGGRLNATTIDLSQIGSASPYTSLLTLNKGTLGNITTGNLTVDSTTKIALTNLGTFDASSGRTITVNSTVQGSGALTKIGAGSLTLAGTTANTYTGLTQISAGVLNLNKSANVNAIAGDGNNTTVDVLINGGTLRNLANNQIATANTATGDATINMTSGAWQLNGKIETVYAFANSGGTFTTGTGGQLTGLGNSITWSGGTNTINAAGLVADKHFDISGGANTVEGRNNPTVTNTSGGTLQVQSGGMGLDFTGSGAPSIGLYADATSPGHILLDGDLSVGKNVAYTGAGATITNLGGGAIQGYIDLNGGLRTFEINDSAAATVELDVLVPVAGGAGGVTKTGAGLLRFSGTAANTYTGATSVDDGTLVLNKSAGTNAIAGTTVNVGNGSGAANSAVLQLGAANQIVDSANLTLRADGNFNLSGNNEIISGLTGTSLGTSPGSPGAVALGGATLTVNGAFDVESAATAGTFLVTGGGSLNLNGTSIFDLYSASSYDYVSRTGVAVTAGGTIKVNLDVGYDPIFGDTFKLFQNGAVGGGPFTDSNFDFTGAARPGLVWDYSGFATDGTLVATTVAGSIWDVNGTGTGATNTTVAPGNWTDPYWSVSAAGTSPTGLFNDGGLPIFSAGTNATGAFTVAVDGGTHNVAGIQTQEGNITLSDGGGVLNLTSAAINVGTGSSLTIGAQLTGGVGLTKQGAGTSLTLANPANSYAGNTFVSAGTLRLGASDVIPHGAGKGDVTVNGLLDLNGYSENINGLNGAGTVDLATAGGASTLTVGNNNASGDFSGAIRNSTGTVSLTKVGTGTQTLSGNNTYQGATTVNGGTLALTAGGLENSSLSINNATFLQSGGTNHVTGGAGSGNLTLTGSGLYRLEGGTLDFQDYVGAGSAWTPNNASTLTTPTGDQFVFSGGDLFDVSQITVGDGSVFTQNGADTNFYVGRNGVGPPALTTIDGGYSLLAGVLHLDAFGADATPEECCDGASAQNDQLTVEGIVFLNGVLDFNPVSFEPTSGDTFTLICADGIELGPNFVMTGAFYRIVPTGDPDHPVALQTLVPEPASVATWCLVLCAGAAAAWRSRRRATAGPK